MRISTDKVLTDSDSQEQVEHLKHIQEKIKGIEFWTPPLNNSTADLMVSPESMDDVEEYLKVKKIDYEVLIRDLQVSGKENHISVMVWEYIYKCVCIYH